MLRLEKAVVSQEPTDGLENKRLLVLRETGLLASIDVPEFDEICARAKSQFGVAMALVTLIDESVQVIKARVGTELEQTPRSVAFCDYTIRADDVLVVPDARLDPRFAFNPLVTGEPFLRFYAGAPLTYLRGIRLGALCLIDGSPRTFSLGDRAELASMADEVVSVIVGKTFEGLVLFPEPRA